MKAGTRAVVPCIDVSRDEVLRYLGYPAGHGGSSVVAVRLAALWAQALADLRPRAVMRVVDGATAAQAGVPRPGSHAGVAVCTVGADLEERAARCSEDGAVLDALLLDAIGSAAAEAAADAVNARLCRWAGRLGLHAAPRQSPGYGDWDTADQVKLLALLPAERVGVSLTEGMMMTPRKSVSFAVPFREEAPDARSSPCGRCGLPRCRHRIMAVAGGEDA